MNFPTEVIQKTLRRSSFLCPCGNILLSVASVAEPGMCCAL